jgi:hypothetical protein
MAFEAILAEAEQFHNVSNRLEALADQHPGDLPFRIVANRSSLGHSSLG